MTTVTIQQAQQELSRLIEDVALGEHILITKGQVPVAELGPIAQPKAKATFGSAKGMIAMTDDFDAPIEDLQDYSG